MDNVAFSEMMSSEWTESFEHLELGSSQNRKAATRDRAGRLRAVLTGDVKALLDVATGAHSTLATREVQRPSTGVRHWTLHFHGSRISGNIVYVSHVLPLHSVLLHRKRSNLGGSAC